MTSQGATIDPDYTELQMEDSLDTLDCFGEFSKENPVCTRHCGTSIQCAVERTNNPKTDIFEHLLTMNFFPARIQ